jgi:hypothetical protein
VLRCTFNRRLASLDGLPGVKGVGGLEVLDACHCGFGGAGSGGSGSGMSSSGDPGPAAAAAARRGAASASASSGGGGDGLAPLAAAMSLRELAVDGNGLTSLRSLQRCNNLQVR